MPSLSLRPRAELMEERILHSADIAPLLMVGAAADTLVQQPLHAVSTDAAVQRSEIVFVDTALPDAPSLLADLQAHRSAGRPIEIVTIDAGQDGIAVIDAALAARHDISAVHVLAHGSDGVLQLGSATLDAQTLLQRAGEVAGWSTALTADAELLLYGGDLAQTAAGKRLLQDLAALTGADTQQATAGAGSAIAAAPNLGTAAAAPPAATVTPQLASLPLNFEANLGQADAGIDYIARGSGVGIALVDGNALLNLKDGAQGNVVRMTLAGAATDVKAQAEGAVTSRSNYLIGGSDPSLQDVPNYAAVRYDGVYEGIDLRYHGQGHQLEYDFIVAPGADWRHIALDFEGVQALAIDADGALRLTLADAAGGTRSIRFAAPVSYQDGPNGREAVASSYVIGADGRVRFEIGAYDRSRALVIDPVLVYGSYLGGTGVDKARAIAVDAAGNAYVTGETASAAFPTTAGAYDTLQNGASDVFVTKLNASGTAVVYSTFIGGSGDDVAWGIAVDAAGSAYVTGSTTSSNLPTVNAFQGARSGTQDAFFFKLNATGTALTYSTYFGGSGSAEVGYGIALDAAGNAYIAGDTDSTGGIASAGAYDTALGGSMDAFLAKFDPTQTGAASRVFGSYLGGSSGSNGADHGLAVAVDTAGKAYVSGYTTANNFPTLNAYDSSSNGGDDAFLTVFNAAGNAITYSTYLGGSGNDSASGIALDAANKVYLSGSAGSGFPTKNAYDATYGGGTWDAIVAKIDPTLSGNASLVYSTYLGGAGTETAPNIVVDSLGRAHVIGFTSGPFPTTADALQATYAGGTNDAFYATLGSKGNSLVYSTYLGGSGDDAGYAIARDDADNIYLAGYSASSNFQQITGGATDTTANGNYDAFVVKFADQALVVTTTSDVLDGNTSSVAALLANKGADGKISLREAIIATNNTPGADAISLAAGTYTLSRTGAGENAALTGDLDITDDLTITGADANTTFIDGAGADRVFDIRGGSVDMSDLTVRNGNVPADKGGGFTTANGTSLTLRDVAVSGNKADKGGAIDSGGIVILDRVTIDGNSAATDGGGIYAEGSGPVTLTNVTLGGNTASGKGGAIFTKLNLSITNSTIANNTAATAGGINGDAGGNATLTNTILANNAGGNASKALISLGHNIDSANTAGLTGPGDRINTNPLLGPLQYNGGTIKTLALLAGSPAINAGTASGAPAVDARELPRTDGNIDIGAFEAGLITLSGNSVAENSANGTAIGVVAVNAADIVADGRFLDVGTPAFFTTYSNGQTLGGWTVTQAAVDLLGSAYDRSPLGGNAVDLAGGLPGFGGPAGAISQTLATVAGQQYQVSFELSGAWFVDSNVKNVRVTFAGTSQDIAISKPAGWNSATDMKWAQQTLTFTAASTSTVLSLDSLNGNGAGPIVADVQVKTSPGSYTFSLIDDAGGRFAVNAVTGALTVAKGSLLDYETATSHEITVRVFNGAALVGDQAFAIQVTPVNESPVITSDGGAATAAVSVAENTSAVTTVTATDPDLPVQTLIYSISGGADAARFAIDASTGLLSFVAAPNYEAPVDAGANNVYDVTVRVSDGTLSDTQAIVVAVTPVNDNNPVITSNGGGTSAAINIAENTTAVTVVAATDADLPVQTLAYSISGGADAARFAINSVTGVLSFVAAPNFEAPTDVGADNVYDVTVQASDGAHTDTQAIAVTVTNVNDNNPVITSNGAGASATVNVAENSTTVTTVTATDADALAALTYTISGGADAARFTINAGTGALSFVAAPNYEAPTDAGTNNIYDVTVLVSDGTLTDTQAIAVKVLDVNEFPVGPVSDVDAAANSVAENAGVGTVVGVTAKAVDADATNNLVTYTLDNSAGGRFAINAANGVVSVAGALDYATASSHTISVRATSADGSFSTAAFTIGVINVNAGGVGAISDTNATANNVAENSAAGTLVGITASAVDPDVADVVTYSLADSAGGRFAINTTTGVVVVAGGLDAEVATSHTIVVRADSTDGSFNTQTFTIGVADVNEFAVGAVSDGDAATNAVDENAAIGTPVGITALAVDADATNKSITYTLDNSAGGRYAIDGATGVVTVAGAIDRETAPSHAIVVRATSADGSSSTQGFTIAVNPLNDNAPVITSDGGGAGASISVLENTSTVTTVTATDADLPAQTLTYSIVGGADQALFNIDAGTGLLSFATAPDFETPTDAGADNVYEVTVQASDGSLNSTQTLSVAVNPVNDNTPTITSDGGGASVLVNVAENTTAVTTVTATDADLPAQALSYSIIGGPDQALFSIDAATGVLSFAAAPNFEAPSDAGGNNVYDVTVQASDGGLSTTQDIRVSVGNVNEAPTIGSPISDQSATQGTAFAFTLPAGSFTDVDAGDTLSYTATLTSGAALPSWLSFNAATQSFSGTPANADVGSFNVHVTATDGSNASASGDFTLTVANVNDAPVLAAAIASQFATQDAAFSFALPSGTFTDVDAGDTLSYSATLASGAALPSWLSFDAATQTFSSTPANADVGAITVRVTAADTANATAFGDFTLTVANVNDAPVLAAAIANQSATQGAAFGFALTAGTFTDIDAGDTLSYSGTLASGAGLPSWLTFNATTQTFSGTPANADVGSLTVRVTATDSGTASAFGDFKLTVANVNDAPVLAQPIAGQIATQGAAFAFTLPSGTFADVDAGDTLSYKATLVSGTALPSWLSFNAATQTFSGTPANADVGAITVRVTAIDGSNATATGDFTLTVANVNDPPVLAQPIANQSATQGAAFGFAMPSGTFTDVDTGDTLSYSATLASGAALPSWLTFNATTQTFGGTPGNADVGAITVRVTATDGSNATATGDFTLTVANVNDAPALAQSIANQSATQGGGFAFTLPAGTFADIDTGDSLSYSATLASGVALPSWLTFNATTKSFSGTPGNADVGLLNVRVTATDTSNATVFGDFTLTVANVNDPPVLAQPIADQAAMQGAAFTFAVPAGTFADVDAGDTLAYRATLTSGAALPAWLTFNATTQTFSGTPANADVGAITVRVTAIDGSNASASGDFTLAVANVNDAPVLAQPIGDHAVFAGTPARFQLPAATFTDPDIGDTLHYAAALADGTALPAWLTFDERTLAFTAAPATDQTGAFVVRVTATDDSGAAAQALFAVVVTTPTFPAPPATADAGAAPAAPTAAPPAATPAAAVAAMAPAAPPALVRAPAATSVADVLAPAMTFASVSEAPQQRGSAGIADSTGSRPASRSDAVLANVIAPDYKAMELSAPVHLLNSDDVLRRLEEAQRHMLEQGLERRTVIASAIAATSGLSVGYVIWLVRGGVLVSSMLSALPAWQMIDPLPVVAAAGVVRTRRSKSSADDADVERLFDERRKPCTAPAPAPAADAAAAKKPGPKETRR